MRWPDAAAVRQAVDAWSADTLRQQRHVVAVGLFGSLARGGWGVRSDVDLLVVVRETDVPFIGRPSAFPTDALPVPADVLVYTADEWDRMGTGPSPAASVRREVVWLALRGGSGPSAAFPAAGPSQPGRSPQRPDTTEPIS